MEHPFGQLCTATYPLYRNMNTSKKDATSTLNPHNTIIVFDIHGVLFNHDYWKMFKSVVRTGYLWHFTRHLLKPAFIKDIIKLAHKGSVAEEYLIGLVSAYPGLKPFASIGVHTANLQKPNKTIITMVEQLKKQGYELHILSNIGGKIFEDLKEKYPELFEHFTSVKVACAQERYLSKPNPAAFVAYVKKFNANGKQIVFIDDKRKNIHTARRLGMTSIFFCCSFHVKNKMKNLGILS